MGRYPIPEIPYTEGAVPPVAKKRTAVLISGRGSNLEALIQECARPNYPAEISLVISNNPDAGGLLIAQKHKIPTRIIPHKNYSKREEFEAAMGVLLQEFKIQIICLAGFMRILTESFVERWKGKVINIHPSLLPAFKGLHVHERVIKEGALISGCTVHFVIPEVDSGTIIAQVAVRVLPKDTPEVLAARVLKAEHLVFPYALQLVAEGRVTYEDSVVVKDASRVVSAVKTTGGRRSKSDKRRNSNLKARTKRNSTIQLLSTVAE